MNDTISSLLKANKALIAREEGYKETIFTLSNSIESKTASITRLMMQRDRDRRDIVEMKRDIMHLQEAVLDMAKTQKANTTARKVFEAGYYGRIGE